MARAQPTENLSTVPLDRQLVAKRYRVRSKIGHGRLGAIFAVTDDDSEELGVEQRLAVQVVDEAFVRDNRLFNMLNAGYSMLRTCTHPNIVDYLKFGRDGRSGYLVMELLEGLSLRDVLADAGHLPLDEVMPIVRNVGKALQLLHAKDIVHGNLTAANVFITHQFDIRLLDVLPLSLAVMKERRLARSELGKQLDARDDVFDLACLVYELLAGFSPLDGISRDKARDAGLGPRRIESLEAAQWAALQSALGSDRDTRTATVGEFVRDFGAGISDRMSAQPDPAGSTGPDTVRPFKPPREDVVYVPAQAAQPAPAAIPEPAAPPATARPVPVEKARRRSKSRAGILRSLLLGTVLAGLGAWYYFGDAREQVAVLIAAIDANTGLELVPPAREAAGGTVPTSPPVVERPVESPPAGEAAAADPVTDNTADDIQETTTGTGGAIATAPDESADSNPGDEASNETVASDTDTALDAGRPADAATAEPSSTQTVITVSEGVGAVPIAIPKTGRQPTPLVWWTGQHTATAGEDFIAVQQRQITDTRAGADGTLFVSLVNDSIAEGRESFYVVFGFHDSDAGHIERVATVRIDIVDDD